MSQTHLWGHFRGTRRLWWWMVADLCLDTLFPCRRAVAMVDVRAIYIHQGGAFLSKWLCNRELTPATAIKVVVTASSLSTEPLHWVAMLRDERCREGVTARTRITGGSTAGNEFSECCLHENMQEYYLISQILWSWHLLWGTRWYPTEPLCPPPMAQPWGSPQERICGLEVLLDRHSQNYSNDFAYSALYPQLKVYRWSCIFCIS